MNIGINMVGPGLYIPHISGGIIINCKRMGYDCSVNAGVVIGNKDKIDSIADIGNNVVISTGAKVFGKIKIGDNSVIAPNAVVVKDIPSNSIVGGVPAYVLKYKS